MSVVEIGPKAGTIQRVFRDLSEADAVDFQRINSFVSLGMAGGVGWQELLQSKRVLIIAESGAGKSHECRQQQLLLWEAGEPAFFLELAALANTEPRKLLSPEEEDRFDAWLVSQSDIATFFLDSIDELKLTLGSFEQALRQLNRALGGQLGRARVVITTRPIPFDQTVAKRWLPVPLRNDPPLSAEQLADISLGRSRRKKTENEPPAWRIVGLLPLNDEQIRQMAAVQNVRDIDGMVADIHRRNAEDFARRPQDLIELCADWNSANRIRSHQEQVAENIRVKLLPGRAERTSLSAERALEGARRLALAALLARKLTIRHSAEADRGGPSEPALDPAIILYDWSLEERATLLERALFGVASYGRVRFHHRSVIEYLSAEQIEAMLSKGMSIKAAKRLLFAETSQGSPIVRPSMRPVAAWMAGKRHGFFREVLQREPEVLLNFADPHNLDLVQRREALQAFVARYGAGGWRGIDVPFIQAHRFVSSELGTDVARIWAAGVENNEVRDVLITLIQAGPLTDCEHIVAQLATADDTDLSERFSAVSALVALNSPVLSEVVRLMETRPTIWTDRVVRGMIARLFPKHMSVETLSILLRRVREDRDRIDDLSWYLPSIIVSPTFPDAVLEPLRARLTECLVEGAFWTEEWPHFGTSQAYLAPSLAEICLKLLDKGARTKDILRSAILSLRFGKDDGVRGEPIQKLQKSFDELSGNEREIAFWAEDEFLQSLHRETRPSERLWEYGRHGILMPTSEKDLPWIMEGLGDNCRPFGDRAYLLEIAGRCLRPDGVSWPDYAVTLKARVSDQPALMAIIDDWLAPKPVDPSHEKWQREHDRHVAERKEKEAKAHSSWVAFWKEVASNPSDAFNEERAYNTAWNLWHAMESAGANSRAEGWNRRFIESNFGKEVADLLRKTLGPIWRKDPPTLAMERKPEERNRIYTRWQLGLAAIAAEAEDPGWALKLTDEEAEIAARYVPIELNGFPVWFETFATVFPDVVDRTIGGQLTFELTEPTSSSQWYSSTLQNLSRATSTLAVLFVPRLRQWLDDFGDQPPEADDTRAASERLRQVVEVLLQHGDAETRDHIRSLAEQRLSNLGERFEDVWLAFLLRLDPEAGVTALERILNAIPIAADSAALDWFGPLFGERYRGMPIDLSQSGFTPDLLLRLVRQAYIHIRRSDDVHHEGTFSPDRRDHAERGRGAILSALLQTKGATGWAAKLELAKDPLFGDFRDRALAIAQEKAAEEADRDILHESDIAKLNRANEAPPISFESMFAVLRDRLDDLDELLLEDVSPRESWAAITEERVMRREIARELRNRSNNCYTVDQEAATADEKETDIRLRTASGHQGVIELKVGEKPRSAADLRDALTDQLVKKYMAADECRAGCLMITIATNRTWDHPESGERLDFKALIEWLNGEAQKIVVGAGSEIRLLVKGLDLRPRLATERKAKVTLSTSKRHELRGTN